MDLGKRGFGKRGFLENGIWRKWDFEKIECWEKRILGEWDFGRMGF